MATTAVKKIKRKPPEIAAKIHPIGEINSYVTMLAYGKSGTGKTAFASTFPKPVLLLDIREKGYETVAKVKDLDLLEIATWDELEEAYWMLEGGTKYASVVVDQLTSMQALAMASVREELDMEESDTLSQRSWGKISGKMQTWVYNFRELYSKDYHVCFNAHERIRDPQEEDDERIAPSVGSNLMPSVASFVNGAVSVIGNTFIREKIDKDKNRTVEYCMRIGPHAYYAAKIRRPLGSDPAPSVLVNPTFDKILTLSKGENVVRKLKKLRK